MYVTIIWYVEYEGVERYLMCHKEHNVSVVVCVGGVRGHWGVKEERGRRSREPKLWLTAPFYNYTLMFRPGFLPYTYTPWVIILCSFPLLAVVHQSQLYPPLTCFPRAGVIANTVSAGKPNKAWHSTPSPGLMMSWYHKYPAKTAAPPSSRHVSKIGEPWAGVCVCVQISDIFWRLSSDRACF